MTPALPLPTVPGPRPPRGRPLVVTRAPDLLDDLLRLAAVAETTVTVATEMSAIRRHWASAPLIVVGLDHADACASAGLPDRRQIVLVGHRAEDGEVWDTAVRIGADHVIFLPEAEPWLVDALNDLDELDPAGAVVLGLVSGRPGTGASTLAVSLALSGLRRDLRTMLIDADPWGRGLAPALAEQAPLFAEQAGPGGLPGPAGRFSHPGPFDHPGQSESPLRPVASSSPGEVPGAAGALAWADLLPRRGDLSVVSWDATAGPTVPPATMSTLLSTARCTSDLVVVDIAGRTEPAGTIALRFCGTVLVVLPAEMRAVIAAERIAGTVSRQCPDVRAVVRSRPSDDLTPETVARLAGLPLAGVISAAPGGPADLGPGRAGTPRGTTVQRFGEEFLTAVGMVGSGPAFGPEARR